MGWFTKLFGQEGKIRFEGECYDGEKFTGKTSIQCWGIDKAELERRLIEIMYVETGKRVKAINVTAFVEC
jgi:hypothetical protein